MLCVSKQEIKKTTFFQSKLYSFKFYKKKKNHSKFEVHIESIASSLLKTLDRANTLGQLKLILVFVVLTYCSR